MKKLKLCMTHLINRALNGRISQKISTVFLLFFILSILLTYFLYQFVSRDYALSNMEQNSRQTLVSVSSNILEMIDNIDNNYNLLLKSGLSDLTHQPIPPQKRKEYDNFLFTVIDTYNHLDAVYIMDLENHIYGVDKFNVKTLAIESLSDAPLYDGVISARGSYILSYNAGNIFIPDFRENFISAIRVINDLETQKPVGFAIMNIPVRSLEALFQTVFENRQTHVALYDEAGQVLCALGTQSNGDKPKLLLSDLNQNMPYHTRTSSHMLTAGLYIPDLGWKIVADFPLESEKNLSGSLFQISLWVLLINIVLMLFCSIIISKSIQHPVLRLIRAMNDAETGEFKAVEVHYPDSEIGVLELNYNHMIEKIQSLLKRLVQEQKKKREMELRALQEQIKPHFLYNTLDAIGYMALTEEPVQVYDAIETLGSFYRESLSSGQQMITVRQELQIVKDYTHLLSLRYESLFKVDYEVDPTLMDHGILKLLLQPLVENAVYHGIKPLGEPGIILIHLQRSEDFLLICVSDNGVGMQQELIDRLLTSSDFEQRKSFGLAGTIERVRITYPEQSTVSIESKKGLGTRITIRLPWTADSRHDESLPEFCPPSACITNEA